MDRGLTEAGPGYREHLPTAALVPYVDALWSRRAEPPNTYSIVPPDGCMDIVWLASGRLVIAGPSTEPFEASAPSCGSSAGIRFRPGIAPSLLKYAASEFRDTHVALEELWPREARQLYEAAEGLSDANEKLCLLQDVVATRIADATPDALVQGAVALVQGDSVSSVDELADALSVSQRHLLRRFVAAVGYGPKTLQRVLRFQRGIRLLRNANGRSLTDIALESGYADHAHMTREVGRLSGIAPRHLAAGRR
jgi:AraC-like DNA-binding protein